MATSTPVHVPLDQYLRTTYRPDRDWINGETMERNMGEMPHASVQAFFTQLFRNNAAIWNVRVFPEQRIQTSVEHYRIADVCVVRRDALFEPVVRTPPLLCIEVLSRDDSMSDIQERVEDYLAMGVPTVWVIDPRRRRAYQATANGSLHPVPVELAIAETPIRVPLPDIFAELDELEALP